MIVAMDGPERQRGHPLPLGARIAGGGVNFALFSRHAGAVDLLLYARPGDAQPERVVALDPARNRSGDVWHVWIAGAGAGQAYAYRVDRGERVLIDPYARALWGAAASDFGKAQRASSGDDGPYVPRSIVADDDTFDWGDDTPPRRPWSETVIYETHVRGLTVHASSRVEHPGTYLGVIEKIPYLLELGVTALELLPVPESLPVVLRGGTAGAPRTNYWGYDPIALFAPRQSYAAEGPTGGQVDEFKRMVRALHAAGLEVILDVVFNHTGEGDAEGPTLSYRALDDAIYYLKDPRTGRYADFSGCGNTLNCNHPVVRDHVISCLRHWVAEMHVDGFRFDLASIMGRDESGAMLPNPPILRSVAEDPVLRDVKLIAEAWDAAGAYQVGSFGGRRWSEWNGRYRDDVRRFWRGDPGMRGAFASRLCGSADLYSRGGKEPLNSINFVACHDGFTLADLVSYERKHNDANGESNRDGADENFSANYGVEGPSDDPAVEAARARQVRNLIATLLLSRGVPMLQGGDEFRRTQGGNNNAYCRDDEVSWYDWGLAERNRDLLTFTRRMIAFRRSRAVLRRERFYTERDLVWFDPQGGVPDWSAGESALGVLIRGEAGERSLCLLFNGGESDVRVSPPGEVAVKRWRAVVDTAEDHVLAVRGSWNDAPPADVPITLAARSLTVLEAE